MKKENILAIHEAGHAVVAHVLGGATSIVAVFPLNDDQQGGARTRSFLYKAKEADRTSQIEAAKRDVMVALAGPAAQQKFKPQKAKKQRLDGWKGDYDNATKGIARMILLQDDPTFDISQTTEIYLNDEQQQKAVALFDQIAWEVSVLVTENWAAIEQTADKLIRLRIIFGDEVDVIVRGWPR
jgi:hypothetical protein